MIQIKLIMSKLRSSIFKLSSHNKRGVNSNINKELIENYLSNSSVNLTTKRKSSKNNISVNLQEGLAKDRMNQQNVKDRLYHRNYGKYKEICEDQSNAQALPYIISLRGHQIKNRHKVYSLTQLEPFEGAQRPTLNQIVKKKINSIDASAARIRQSSFLLRQASGYDTKVSCQFQSTLRQNTELLKSKEERRFLNIIKPIKFAKLQRKKYKLKDLICEHQKRLFNLEQQKQ